jgi:long-subunit fatty acid transport protein
VQWSLYDGIEVDVDDDDVAGLGNIDQLEQTGYQDTVDARVGARYRLVEPLWVFFGGGFESNAFKDGHLGPETFDSFKVGVAGGGLWDLDRAWRVSVGYNQFFYVPRDIEKSDRTPPTSGRHSAWVGILNTHLRYSFGDRGEAR